MIEELKKEQEKYHNLYILKNNIFDELKADAFKLAVEKLESKGIKETYLFFKNNRDKCSDSYDTLGRNLSQAYDLVVGKLWKHYKKVILCEGKESKNGNR